MIWGPPISRFLLVIIFLRIVMVGMVRLEKKTRKSMSTNIGELSTSVFLSTFFFLVPWLGTKQEEQVQQTRAKKSWNDSRRKILRSIEIDPKGPPHNICRHACPSKESQLGKITQWALKDLSHTARMVACKVMCSLLNSCFVPAAMCCMPYLCVGKDSESLATCRR